MKKKVVCFNEKVLLMANGGALWWREFLKYMQKKEVGVNYSEQKEENFTGPFHILLYDRTVVDGYNELTWEDAVRGLIDLKGIYPNLGFLMVDSTGVVIFNISPFVPGR